MTIAEKKHYDAVSRIGCIVCIQQGFYDTPAEIHHIRSGVGAAQRSHFTKTLPLCPIHHRTGGYGQAYHRGPKIWQEKYGSEEELLTLVQEILGL